MVKLFGVIAKVVKIGDICKSFCYGYGNNLYNPFVRFQRFRFSEIFNSILCFSINYFYFCTK